MTKPISPASRRPLTLRDLSAASGVSEMTASRVLRNRGEVSEATRARVLEAARRIGYVPNRIAGSLASRRVHLVGVIVPSLSNMVYPEVLAGISEVLDTAGLHPMVGVTGYLPEREEQVILDMLSWRPTGLILAGLEHTDEARSALARADVPVVEIMDIDGDPVDSAVGISHRGAGRQMARAILGSGYRRIAFLGPEMPTLDHRARKRREGFEEVLADAGVPLAARAHYTGGSSLARGRDMTADLLARNPELDFLCCSNDLIGAGALLWCLGQGLGVPERIGLAGFNGLDLLDGLPRRLATTDACRREIGRIAAAIVTGEHPRGEVVELQPTLFPGDTMRPAGTDRPMRSDAAGPAAPDRERNVTGSSARFAPSPS